jgi:hypothetical protein
MVDAPLDRAWHHFARAAAWPSWHTDLKRVEVTPAGELGPESVATLHLHKGPSTTFRMTEFVPYQHWTWVARALWFTINYDHRFERVDDNTTRIVLHIEIGGPGKSVFGRLVAAGAGKSLDKALPRLAHEMKTST